MIRPVKEKLADLIGRRQRKFAATTPTNFHLWRSGHTCGSKKKHCSPIKNRLWHFAGSIPCSSDQDSA
jgi:hypothetical protein